MELALLLAVVTRPILSGCRLDWRAFWRTDYYIGW